MVTLIDIKPLSVNEMYIGSRNGTRRKSQKYKAWKRSVAFLLPKMKLPDPPFRLLYEFGFSSKGSDIDNHIKSIQDSLQSKYSFNDNQIHEFTAKKKIVPKGKEYIKFEITPLTQEQ